MTEQVTSEVWLFIIHGSRGVVYFAHQFAPKFIEAGVLSDTDMTVALQKINAQIKTLAPILNGPTIKNGATVASSAPEVPVDMMVKQHDGATYVLAAAMRDGQTYATFTLPGRKGRRRPSYWGKAGRFWPRTAGGRIRLEGSTCTYTGSRTRDRMWDYATTARQAPGKRT